LQKKVKKQTFLFCTKFMHDTRGVWGPKGRPFHLKNP
jgi:hypothetical protein